MNNMNGEDALSAHALTLSERLCLLYLKLGQRRRGQRRRAYIETDFPLRPLTTRFPNFEQDIRGKRVIDFGSGDGHQSFAMAQLGAVEVLGVEILDRRLDRAKARQTEIPTTGVSFTKYLGEEHDGQYDLAISLNSLEHFSDPNLILKSIFKALRPGGRLLLSFGPPWWSAYGPHQAEFTRSPWPHLFFGEKTFMKIRGLLMNESEKVSYSDRWLNQMSVTEYERTMRRSGFVVVHQEYFCTRGLALLKKLPGARELAINRIACILERPS